METTRESSAGRGVVRLLGVLCLTLVMLAAGLVGSARAATGSLASGSWTYYDVTLPTPQQGARLVLSSTASSDFYLYTGTNHAAGNLVASSTGQTLHTLLVAPSSLSDGASYHVRIHANAALNYTYTPDLSYLRTLSWDNGATWAGTSLTSQPDTAGGDYLFKVTGQAPVHPGWRNVLKVTSGEADLYLQQGAPPIGGGYSSTNTGSDVIYLGADANLNGQEWYLRVHALPGATWQLSSGDLYAPDLTWDPGNAAGGTNLLSQPSTGAGDYFYRITTPASATGAWRTVLKVSGGEADFYQAQGGIPFGDTTYKSARAGDDGLILSANEFATNQVWYLRVHSGGASSSWSIFSGEIYARDLGTLTDSGSTVDFTSEPTPSGDISLAQNVKIGPEGTAYFKVAVDATTLGWRIWLSGAANTLWVRKDAAPVKTSWVEVADQFEAGQTLLVPPYLTNAVYFVGVTGNPGQVVSFDSRRQQITTVAFNSTTPKTITGYGYTTYRVDVPIQQIAWQTSVTPGAGNQDPQLYVRQGNIPNRWTNDGFSEAPAGVADSITQVPPTLTDGTWYVTVYGSGNFSYTLKSGVPTVTGASFINDPNLYFPAGSSTYNPQTHYPALCPSTNPSWPCKANPIANDDTNRSGWRYYQVSDINSQLGYLGWQLDLAGQVGGTEIALRKNAVPSRWNYRTGGSAYNTYVSSSSTLDLSSTLGFLQHPGHPADIWYVGVYTPNQALGPFQLTTREIPSPPVTLKDTSAACQADPNACSNAAKVTGQPYNTWKWFKVTVPDDPTFLGWDLRVKTTMGAPVLTVRRDQLPPSGYEDWWWKFSTSWPTGYQWTAGADWTGRGNNANGSASRDQNLVLGLGSPLEPGTYYVGITGAGGIYDDLSYTLVSRGIGRGNGQDEQPWPIQVQDLAFEGQGAVASGSSLQPREAAYYRVSVPEGKKSWALDLKPTLGEARLALRSAALPNTVATSGYATDSGTKREKNGQEFFYKYAASGTGTIGAGYYYLAVISEGQNPSGSNIGTGGVNYTITSSGEMAVSDKTSLTLSGASPVTWTGESLTYGSQKVYRFRVPAGLTMIEARLKNRGNTPTFALQSDPAGQPAIPWVGSLSYTAQEGGASPNQGQNDSLITVPNPAAGDYTLTVASKQTCMPDWPYTCNEFDASYDVEITAHGTTDLPYRNGSLPVSNQEAYTWRYFKVTVPSDALGWDLRLKTTAGHPAMIVRRDLVPPGGYEDWWWKTGTTWPTGYQWSAGGDWTGRPNNSDGSGNPNQYLVLGLGSPLEPGTYYVGVSGGDTMSYTLESRGIGVGSAAADGLPWPIQVQDLSFTSTGSSKGGTGLPAREAAYYRVNVPADSKSWVLNLVPTLGEASMIIRQGTLPNTQVGSSTEWYATRRAKNGQEFFYKYADGGKNSITPGYYYVAVVSEGVAPSGSNIGTGGIDFTLTSAGEMPIYDKTSQALTAAAPITWNGQTLTYGAQKIYRFRVPDGLTSIEVRLKNRTNIPTMSLLNEPVGQAHIPGANYPTYPAHEGGYSATQGASDSLITVANPPAGDYTLNVATRQTCMDAWPYTCFEYDAGYDVEVTAHVPTDVTFRDSSTPVAGQDPATWQFFKVTVPADAVGWDLRLKATSGHPYMVVRRDQLPPGGYEDWWWKFGTTWSSGYQWTGGGDWTGRNYTSAGTPDTSQYLVLGLGSPLEPGTYYVGVSGYSGYSEPLNYTLASRGIGVGKALSDGQSWPLQVLDLPFTGSKSASGLAPRENAYYRVTVPAGSKSWALNLTPTLGEARLALRASSLPNSSATAGYGSEGYGTMRGKNGEEYFYKYPDSGRSTITPGNYYLAVVSEGQGPNGSSIGTGGVNYTLTSLGEIAISDKTGQTLDVQTPVTWIGETLKYGAQKLYRFRVPTGLTSLEVRLKNKVNNSFMSLESPAGVAGSVPVGNPSYVAHEGGVGPDLGTNDTLISAANPAAGDYTLNVGTRTTCIPVWPWTCNESDVSYDVEISAKTPIALAADNGSTTGHLVDQQFDYYQITVPDNVNGFPVAGLKIGTATVNGSVHLSVGKGNLPNTPNQPTLAVNAPFAVLTPPYLAPGTWYIAVQGVGITDYSITTQLISADPSHHARSWTMPAANGSFPACPDSASQANLLPAPLFGDAGVLGPDGQGLCSKVDNPSTHDQGIDLAQDDWHFYRVNVPDQNGGELRTVVEALSGKPELYIRRGSVPSLYHYDDPNNPNAYWLPIAYERSQTLTGTMYGNWVPMDRRLETQLAPGEWWIGIRAVNSNVRYRLKVAAGNVRNGSGPVDSAGFFQDLDNPVSAPNGKLSGQTLAAGDMRYYRVTVPQSSTTLADSTPVSYTVNLQKQVGNVTVLIRDTLPPGQGASGNGFGYYGYSYNGYFQDWYDDNSSLGNNPYVAINTVGDTALALPPLQPGKIYYLGVFAVSDASFDLSWKASASKLALTGTIPFVNGGVTTTLAAGEKKLYRIDAPANAVYWQQFAQHAPGISLYLAQDTVPPQDGYAHWTVSGQTNSSMNHVMGSYPWQPGHSFYLLAVNTSAGSLPFTFVMNGVAANPGTQGLLPGNIATFAGGGVGNSTPATSSILNYPKGIALDAAGNLYIADTSNHLVRKVAAATGTITTVAGTGLSLFGGDGGPATAAPLNAPDGVALDAAGNLYIADTGNHRVRKVSAATGIISTVAGNGSPAFSGDRGQAVTASLYYPSRLLVDAAGNLYISDTGNQRVRKVAAATGIITTVAGGGNWGQLGDGGAATSAWLYTPQGLALDAAGNLYIADYSNHRIRKVSAASGTISTVAGSGTGGYAGDGGPAGAAQLNAPTGVAFDASGNLYIADRNNYRIRKVAAATGTISTLAGGGSGVNDGALASAAAITPEAVQLDASGNIYLSDYGNHRVRKITAATGIISTVAGTGGFSIAGDGGPATSAALATPEGLAVDAAGNLYIGDWNNARIRKVSATTGAITTVAGTGAAGFGGDQGAALAAAFNGPRAIAVDGAGNVFFTDLYNCRVRKIDGAGMISTVAGAGGCGFSGDGGAATEASLYYPHGLAFDASGNLYIADYYNNRIRKVDPAGIISTVAGNGNAGYAGDGGSASAAQLYNPISVTYSAGNLYIADYNNQRVRKVVLSSGIITSVAGNGSAGFSGDGAAATAASLSSPWSVAADAAGNLYIADFGNSRVRKVDAATGTISTYAGNWNQGFSGDGGPATLASLNAPKSLALDAGGNLYIADSANNRVRIVIANLTPVTVATPPAGSYTAPVSVTLAASRPGTTYYTTDGTVPSTGSAKYSAPLLLSSSTTLKFFSVDALGNAEGVKSASYSITMAAPKTTASPAGGVFSAPLNVTLSCNDGSGPGCGSTYWCVGSGCTPTTLYSGGIPVTGSQIIRFYSKDTAAHAEAVNQASYTVVPGYNLAVSTPGAAGSIVTYAGGGTGNNTAGSQVSLNYPQAVALDALGNVYLADTNNHQVRKITAATGTISTVAGTGSAGFSGDGGPASQASLDSPRGVALDAGGNLYIADVNNHRIRKVTPAGTITTVAGNGDNLYPGDGSPAVASSLSPVSVATDSAGNLYFSEGNTVKKVDGSGIVTTVAGGGTWGQIGDGGLATDAFLYNPLGLAVDGSGNLYIADYGNNRVRKVSGATGIITTVAGNGTAGLGGDAGPATDAELNQPLSVGLDGAGNLYIADRNNSRIRRVNLATGIIGSFAGMNGGSTADGVPAAAASIDPYAVACDAAGNLYLADYNNQKIRKVSAASGLISTLAGGGVSYFAGDGGPASSATLYLPQGSALDAAGNLYFADQYNNRIRKVSAATGAITTVAGTGQGGYSGDFGQALQATFNSPKGVTVDPAGNLYIADTSNCRIRKVDTAGQVTTVAGAGCSFGGDGGPALSAYFYYPTGVALDAAGNLYVADYYNNRVRKVDAGGTITTVAGDGNQGYAGDGGAAASAQLYYPSSVALDAAGNLYIADYGNHRVRKVAAGTGVVSSVAGGASPGYFGDGGPAASSYLRNPAGVATDQAGNLYIADYGNHVIRRVDAVTGVIVSVAGDALQGFSGDGGPALLARLNHPSALAVDPLGNIFIADSENNRIREVVVNAVPVTVANPPAGSFGAPVSVTLSTNEPATTYYSVNGSAPSTLYTGAIQLSSSATVKFYSVDALNNTEAVKSAAYTITMGTPKTSATPAGGVYASAQSVTLSCNDGSGPGCASTYWCLGSGCNPTTVYSGPIAVGASSVLRFYSKDSAAHAEPVNTANYTVYAGYNLQTPLPGGIGSIVTYAGGGVGNNVAGSAALLDNAQGVALDGAGNLYIADTDNQLVRKVSATTGLISTVAGIGSRGFSGDGGPALQAALDSPKGVALDGAGNLYIADAGNHRVRKVTPAGTITTVAGNGNNLYPGDGSQAVAASVSPVSVVADQSGTFYFTDGNKIRKVDGSGLISTVAGGGNWGEIGDGGLATDAFLYNPFGLALDASGNLFIADQNNQRIRRVTLATGIITTVAGNGTAAYGGDGGSALAAQLNYPAGITLDGAGNLYIVDRNNYRMRRVSAATGIITTVAGVDGGSSADGIPANSALINPYAAVADAAGNYYLADANQNRIRRVSAATGLISTVAGGGSDGFSGDGGQAPAASLNAPQGAVTDATGNLYFADQNNHRIRKVSASSGTITTVAGTGQAGFSGDFGAATQATLNSPRGVALDPSGNLYIADSSNCRVRKVDANGMISTVAGNGCGYYGDGGPAAGASLYMPYGVALDASGNLYIADTYNNRIRKVDTGGTITTVAGNGSQGYSGDGGQASAAQLNYPYAVSVAGSGNLYIADYGNHRIRRVTAGTGIITTAAGTGNPGFFGDGGPATSANLKNPTGVYVASNGTMYLSDYGNNVIRRIDVTTGVILTVAGNLTQGFSGDGGPATLASLSQPAGIALDPAGNVLFADSGNGRIREILLNQAPVTVASPPAGSFSAPVSVTLSASEPGITYYTLNGNVPTTSSSVYSGPILISATTTVKFFTADLLGNKEAVKSAAYTVTMGTPRTTANPAGGIFNLPQNVTLSCNDGSGPGCGSTYWCLGAGCTPATVYSAPIPVTGSQVLRFYSKDTSGNAEPVSQALYTVFPGYGGGSPLPGNLGTITTVAGGGVGNGSPALVASLQNPQAVALDAAGNYYIADTTNNLVRKVSAATGVITTVAGTGSAGFSGDGGPAGLAALNSPRGVTLDTAGNLYIADYNNHRIRKVDGAGTITTVAGNGDSVYPGDGTPAVSAAITPHAVVADALGNLYFAQENLVRKVDSAGLVFTVAGGGSWGPPGDGGPASSAWLYNPSGLAVDSAGNLFISETYGQRVRKVTVATGVITTVAGTGSAGFTGDGGQASAAQLYYPAGIALDGAGNLYIADRSNYRIRRVAAASGIISTVAGNGSGGFSGDGGAATDAGMSPLGIAADGAGNLYLTEPDYNRVRKVTAATGTIASVAGSGAPNFAGDGGFATGAALGNTFGVATDASGNLYLADRNNHRVRKVNAATGIISTVAGNGNAGFSGDGGPADQAQLYSPVAVALDAAGNLFIADTYNCKIRRVDGTGTISTVAGTWCGYGGDGGLATQAQIYYPTDLAIDGAGNLYLTDSGYQRVRKITSAGVISTVAGNGNSSYSGDGGPASSAGLEPTGIAVDAAGNLYIADGGNHRVRKLTASTGLISTVAGVGNPGLFGDGGAASAAYLWNPAAVALDPSGNLYIADQSNRVRRVDAGTGVIVTVAGTSVAGFTGDGGPATSAELSNPQGVALDSLGNLYIADTNNSRIRKVSENLLFTVTLAPGPHGSIGGPTQVSYGSMPSYQFQPDTGYHVTGATVNGVSLGAVSSYSYTNWITADQSITASFAINSYTVSFSASAGGTLSGNLNQTVNHGSSASTVTAQPGAGYHLVNWTDGGGAVLGTQASLTLSNVTASLSVTANFAYNTYSITTSAGAGGSITPTQTVNQGANSSTISVTPNQGYHITQVKIDNVVQTVPDQKGYSTSFSNVTANHTVSASFAADAGPRLSVTLSSVAGGGGSVHSSPGGIACTLGTCYGYFGSGTQVTLIPTPDANSVFSGWTGACTAASGNCTVTMNADLSATAKFSSVPPARSDAIPPVPYTSLQSAYNDAAPGSKVLAREFLFTENLVFNRNILCYLNGGYDTNYVNQPGATAVHGNLFLRSGTLKVKKLELR